MRARLVSLALIIVTLTAPFVAAQKVDLTVDVSKAGAKITATSSASSPSTSATAFMRASGSVQAPQFLIRGAYAMTSSQRSKR